MNVEAIRPLFSRVLARKETYLANHSLGRPLDRMSSDVASALDMWYERMDECWDDGGWLDELNLWRSNTAKLIGLERSDCIVSKTSAGQGLRTVLNCFVGIKPLNIVTTTAEFDSIDFILKTYEAQGVAQVTWVGPHRVDRGVALFDAADICNAITPKTNIVVVSRTVFTTGQILDRFHTIVDAAHAVGAVFVVDLYHAAGVIPLQMESAGWDFAIGGSYKYLRGGPGACWLAIHPKTLSKGLQTLDTGWFAKAGTFGYEREPAPKFKSGGDGWMESTPAVLMPYQAKSGLEFVLCQGVENLRKTSLDQLKVIQTVFKSHGLDLYEPEDRNRFGAFALLPTERAAEIAKSLAKAGVVVDARQGCVRLGPDFLNTDEDFERTAVALRSLLK